MSTRGGMPDSGLPVAYGTRQSLALISYHRLGPEGGSLGSSFLHPLEKYLLNFGTWEGLGYHFCWKELFI